MAATGDVYMLTDSGVWQGELNQNVYFYRIEDAPTATAAEGLATAWVDEVLPLVRAFQSNTFEHTKIHVVNLFDLADVYEETISLLGTITCTSPTALTPSFVAARFGLTRDNARVRNGAKYYSGICETNVNGNLFTGLSSAFTALADELIDPLVAGVTDTFRLVLVKRTRVVVPDPTPLNPDNRKYAYSLPTSQEEMGDLWAYVRSASQDGYVSHMDSRQRGRGV